MQESNLENNANFENTNRVQILMQEIEREYRNLIGYDRIIRDIFSRLNPKYLFESAGKYVVRRIAELELEENDDRILYRGKNRLKDFSIESIIVVSLTYRTKQLLWKKKNDSLIPLYVLSGFLLSLAFLCFSQSSLDLFLIRIIYSIIFAGSIIVYYSFFVFKQYRELEIVDKCIELLEDAIEERKYNK